MFVIKRLSDGKYLNHFSLSQHSFQAYFADRLSSAMHFSCVTEARATVEFLINVVDEEFDYDLSIVRLISDPLRSSVQLPRR